MLSVSTVPEALSFLSQKTGYDWTESKLFDFVTKCGIELHAAAPLTAQTTIQEFRLGQGLVEICRLPAGHSLLAVLFPWQVAQLWIAGETNAGHPSDHNAIDGQYKWFTEPVKVTREQVRIRSTSLSQILRLWNLSEAEVERHRLPAWAKAPRTVSTNPQPEGIVVDTVAFRREDDDDGLLRWMDSHIDATYWFKQSAVMPRDAAMLLCNANPQHQDITEGGGEQLGIQEYEKLLEAFEKFNAAVPKARTLMEWRAFARERRLTYHEWIDVWVDLLRRELDEALGTVPASVTPVVHKSARDTSPWDVEDPRDPPAKEPWYPAVRFFARQLVREDPTLLLKRPLLLKKVAACLRKVGRKKRGGVKDFMESTLNKALSKVDLE